MAVVIALEVMRRDKGWKKTQPSRILRAELRYIVIVAKLESRFGYWGIAGAVPV